MRSKGGNLHKGVALLGQMYPTRVMQHTFCITWLIGDALLKRGCRDTESI